MKTNKAIDPSTFNSTQSATKSNDKTKTVEVKDFNSVKSNTEIHYDGNSIMYALNKYEYETLKKGAVNDWKNYLIASLSLFFPFLLNTIIELKNFTVETPTWTFFINLLFTVITLILSIIFEIFRRKNDKGLTDLFNEIENKPKLKV